MKPELPADITMQQFLRSFQFEQTQINWINHFKYGYPKSLEAFHVILFEEQIKIVRANRLIELKLRTRGLTHARQCVTVIDSLKSDESNESKL